MPDAWQQAAAIGQWVFGLGLCQPGWQAPRAFIEAASQCLLHAHTAAEPMGPPQCPMCWAAGSGQPRDQRLRQRCYLHGLLEDDGHLVLTACYAACAGPSPYLVQPCQGHQSCSSSCGSMKPGGWGGASNHNLFRIVKSLSANADNASLSAL